MSLDTSGPTALILLGMQIGSLPQTLEWRTLSMLGMQKDPLAEGLRESALPNLFASSWQ